MTALEAIRPDPSPVFEAAYRAVAQRMQGLPVVNAALQVQAVGFRLWQGCWLGVVVTPWFMNLTLAPRVPAQWVALPVGGKRRMRFPAGDYEFIGANDPTLGDFQVCSLFSPMHDFADAPSAALVARLALEALFDAAHAEVEPAPEAAKPEPPALATDLDRRGFLRGRASGEVQ